MSNQVVEDEIEMMIENAVGELYRGLFRLRKSNQIQREYETMGRIMNMLMEDRDYLRRTLLREDAPIGVK